MTTDSTPTGGPLRVMLVYGTRPEAIKLAPLVTAMRDDERFNPIVVVTGQHREMLDQVHDFFGIVPDDDLDIHSPGQTLTQITNRSLQGVGRAIEAYRPDAVVVQGDTTSAFAAALAAFYHEIPVLHVEAGLRTGDISSPFPEEANRRLISQVTTLHLCPTTTSRDNLLRENTAPQTVRVTGNTVIDALLVAVDRRVPPPDEELAAALKDASRRVVLVTAHRRESWGEPMRAIGRAVARLAELPALITHTVREGRIVSSDSFCTEQVADPMRARFPDAIGADMETCAMAQVCWSSSVDWISLRAVSDLCGPSADQAFHMDGQRAAGHSAEAVRAYLSLL